MHACLLGENSCRVEIKAEKSDSQLSHAEEIQLKKKIGKAQKVLIYTFTIVPSPLKMILDLIHLISPLL